MALTVVVVSVSNLVVFCELVKSEYALLKQCDSKCDWILETDQIVTLGLFHFIGSANCYTYTLHIHSAITGLG